MGSEKVLRPICYFTELAGLAYSDQDGKYRNECRYSLKAGGKVITQKDMTKNECVCGMEKPKGLDIESKMEE